MALVLEATSITTPGVGSNPSITVPASNSGDRLMIVLAFIAGDLPTANDQSYTTRFTDTQDVNIQYAVYEKTAGASEATSVGFTSAYGYYTGIGARWSGAQSGGTDNGTDGGNKTFGTTITALSISITSGSDVVEIYTARNKTITKTGANQNGYNGGVALAVLVNEGATSTSNETATLSGTDHNIGNQVEVLAAAGASGRVMSSLAGKGGLAGRGGIAGPGGGLAGISAHQQAIVNQIHDWAGY